MFKKNIMLDTMNHEPCTINQTINQNMNKKSPGQNLPKDNKVELWEGENGHWEGKIPVGDRGEHLLQLSPLAPAARTADITMEKRFV